MNGKKKLISKITALLLALLLTNHFVFQAYASGDVEVVVTESAVAAVEEAEVPTEAVSEAEAELTAEEPAAEEAAPEIPAAVVEESEEVPEEVLATITPTVIEPAAEEAAEESLLEILAAEEAAEEETVAEEAAAEEAVAEEAAAEEVTEEAAAEEAAAEEVAALEAAAEEAALEAPAEEAAAEEPAMEIAAEPAEVGDAASTWNTIMSASGPFNVANIQAAGIADSNFAFAIYNSIINAGMSGYGGSFGWFSDLPVPLTAEEIADKYEDGEYADDVALVKDILENYAGDIDAVRSNVANITGWQLLKSVGSVDLRYNKIEDISGFTMANAPTWTVNGKEVNGLHSGWIFLYNPIWQYPDETDEYPYIHNGNATHNFPTALAANGNLKYLFGETSNPTIELAVKMGGDAVSDWMFDKWVLYSAAGTAVPKTVPALTENTSFNSTTVQILGLTEAGTVEMNLIPPTISYKSSDTASSYQGNTIAMHPSVILERYGLLYVDIETKTFGGFHFKKVSSNDASVPVEGAVYTLYRDAACTDEIDSYTTDANGEFTVENLPAATYYLKETKTPDGYELSDEVFEIVIDEVTTTTSVEGGVPSITLDARTDASDLKAYSQDINLTAEWHESSQGGFVKSIAETTDITAQMIDQDARAIITNKGTTGYKKIDSISATAAGEKYDTAVSVVVSTGLTKDAAEAIGTYSSLADATTAINDYMAAKSLNGNIYVDISNTYTLKYDVYGEVEGKDTPEPVKMKIPVEKIVKGGDGTYTFQLCDANGNEIESVDVTTEGGEGTAEFSEMTFAGPNPFNPGDGTYTYIVKEVDDSGNRPNVTFDTTEYTYVVAVKEGEHVNENGETVQGLYLEVTKNGEAVDDYTATFTNIQMLPVAVKLEAQKALENAELLYGEFGFVLIEEGTGVEIQACNDENGKIEFGTMYYYVPGTYTYTLQECLPNVDGVGSNLEGITIDESTYQVTVVVALKEGGTAGESVATVYVDGTQKGTSYSDGNNPPTPVTIETGVTFINTAELPEYDFVGYKEKDDDVNVEAGEFTFALTVDNYTGLQYVVNGEAKELTADVISAIPTMDGGEIDFDSVFDCIRFPAVAKEYIFTLTENDIEGESLYVKDGAVFTIKVPVVLDEETGLYEIGEVEGEKNGEAVDEVVFTNTHKRAPLTISKTVAPGGNLEKKFDFTVKFDAPIDDLVITEGVTSTPVLDGLDKVGFKFSLKNGESFTIKNLPVGIGYTVTEAADAGSSYYPTEAISGSVKEENETITNKAAFDNIIKRGPIAITKAIENTKDYMDAENDEFEFAITITPETGAVVEGFSYTIDNGDPVDVNGLTTTVSIKAGQVIQIVDLPYGTTVTARETNAEALNYTAEEAEKSGAIYAGTQHEHDLAFEFVNVKKDVEPISVQPAAKKTIDGEVPTSVVMLVDGVKTKVPFEDAFTFYIARESAPDGAGQLNNAAQTANNTADGSVNFGKITGIDTPGEYVFKIWEKTPAADDSYLAYDGAEYYYKVNVVYNKESNELEVESEAYEKVDDGEAYAVAEFDNKPKEAKPVSIKLDAEKTVNGTAPVMTGTYSFVLTNTSAPEGAEAFAARTASDLAGGTVDFGEITYVIPGTYTYEIKEIKGNAANIVYDERIWTVTVVVEDDGTSTNSLGAEVTYAVTGENPSIEENPEDKAQFANYTKIPVELPVEKTIEGNPIYGIPTFNFTIEAGADTPDAPLPATTTISLTADDFNGASAATAFGEIVYDAAGTYQYTIYETAETKDGWTYDTTPATAVVTVAFENGKLVATTEFTKGTASAEAAEFLNDFTPVPIDFSKQDLGGEELPGAKIQVFDSEGNLVEEWESTDTPHKISGLLPGDYVMHEVAAPDGYAVTTDIPFTVDEDGLVEGGREVDMTDAPTKVDISKQDLGGEEVPGAQITIYDSEGNVAETVFGETCEWTSTDTPKTIEGLPAGSYTLHEVVAPDGYTVTTDINFTINEDGTVTVTDENGNPVDVDQLVLTDAPITVNFSKTDAGGEELPGAVITVFDKDGNVAKTVKGEELTWTSTNETKVIEGLPAGEYVMHEDAAPAGYEITNDIKFTVEADTGKVTITEINGEAVNQEADDSTVVMVDELTEISISKQDLGGEEVPGAKIQILDKDGNVAESVTDGPCEWISSDTPHEIKGLPAGSYVLHEEVAPDGYTVTTDINFTVNVDGTVTVTDENGIPVDVDQLVLTDAPTKVNFSKQDLGGAELPGAQIVVYDENGSIAKTVFGEELAWTSTDTPKTVEGLPAGKYVMHEVAAPEGYAVTTDITFVVEENTGKVTVIAINGQAVDTENNTVVMVDGPVPSTGTPTPSVATPTPSASTPTPSTATTTPTNAKTGDPSNALLWMMTALDSVGIFAAGSLIGRKKRRDDDEENEE